MSVVSNNRPRKRCDETTVGVNEVLPVLHVVAGDGVVVGRRSCCGGILGLVGHACSLGFE
jgi:hypothetical protein